jgi:hypothetical protein
MSDSPANSSEKDCNYFLLIVAGLGWTLGKVCRWNRQTDQLTRWMVVALLRAQEGFWRVRGHKELRDLAAALGRAAAAASSLHRSFLSLALCATLAAQQAPPNLHYTAPMSWQADWAGELYRVYFPQWSSNL